MRLKIRLSALISGISALTVYESQTVFIHRPPSSEGQNLMVTRGLFPLKLLNKYVTLAGLIKVLFFVFF